MQERHDRPYCFNDKKAFDKIVCGQCGFYCKNAKLKEPYNPYWNNGRPLDVMRL